jgi:hypothetical protein
MRPLLTPEQTQFLIDNYANTSTEVLAAQFGVSVPKLHSQAGRLGLKKSKEYISNVTKQKWAEGKHEKSRICQFKKGQQPPNKGKRIHEWLSPEAIEKQKQTRFKQGALPHNTYSDEQGVISIRKDKRGRPYKYIKLAHSKWEHLHTYLWKQAHGPIPKGHIVTFKDQDSLNCTLENLEMITRSENMVRNSIHTLPEDIKSNVILLRSINRKLKKFTPTI